MLVNVNDNNVAGVIKENPICCIKLWAEWCGPCKGIVKPYEELSDKVDAEVLMAEMSVDENPDFTSAYNIRSIPAILVFVKGEHTQTFIGTTAVVQLADYLDTNPLGI